MKSIQFVFTVFYNSALWPKYDSEIETLIGQNSYRSFLKQEKRELRFDFDSREQATKAVNKLKSKFSDMEISSVEKVDF